MRAYEGCHSRWRALHAHQQGEQSKAQADDQKWRAADFMAYHENQLFVPAFAILPFALMKRALQMGLRF